MGRVIVGAALALFVVGRAGSPGIVRGFGGSLAWAHDAEDLSDDATAQQNDASDQDGVVSTPSYAPQEQLKASTLEYCIKHPFPGSGLWSGTVMDNNQGAGTISASLFQCNSKLGGTWQDSFVPPAFWKGTISSSNNIKAQMRFHISGKCGYTFTGTLKNDNEISGNYTLHNCKGMGPDGGSFDMFKTP